MRFSNIRIFFDNVNEILPETYKEKFGGGGRT
jgi:hypothetical protein